MKATLTNLFTVAVLKGSLPHTPPGPGVRSYRAMALASGMTWSELPRGWRKSVEWKRKRVSRRDVSRRRSRPEPSVLLGCQGGGDIAQDTGEAIEDKCSWGRLRGGKGRGDRSGRPL